MSTSAEQEARTAAEQFRERHRLGVQPLGDLVALIEQTADCDVAVVEANADEHGLTMCDPERGAVFVAVARTRRPMRQRSTLAHELAHVVFRDWNENQEFDKRSHEEIRADSFARHLLVPVEGVRQLLGTTETAGELELSAVAQRFLVSPAIAAIAMRDAGYVDRDTSKAWMRCTTQQLATRYGWSDHYATLQEDSDRLRAPQALVARATRGYSEGVVSAQTIATLRGVGVERMTAELVQAGIRPELPSPSDVNLADLPDIDIDLSELEDEDWLQ